jgi:hypothetical protein
MSIFAGKDSGYGVRKGGFRSFAVSLGKSAVGAEEEIKTTYHQYRLSPPKQILAQSLNRPVQPAGRHSRNNGDSAPIRFTV